MVDIELQIVKIFEKKEGIKYTHWNFWYEETSPNEIEGEVTFLRMEFFAPDEIVAKYWFKALLSQKEGESYVVYAVCKKCGLKISGDEYGDIQLADGGPFCPRCQRPTLKPVYKKMREPVVTELKYERID